MGEAIVVALISGCVTLLGTALTIWATSKKTEQNMQTSQAVTDEKIQNLTTEVRELKTDVRGHNNFGSHITVLETQMQNIDERVRNLERGA